MRKNIDGCYQEENHLIVFGYVAWVELSDRGWAYVGIAGFGADDALIIEEGDRFMKEFGAWRKRKSGRPPTW